MIGTSQADKTIVIDTNMQRIWNVNGTVRKQFRDKPQLFVMNNGGNDITVLDTNRMTTKRLAADSGRQVTVCDADSKHGYLLSRGILYMFNWTQGKESHIFDKRYILSAMRSDTDDNLLVMKCLQTGMPKPVLCVVDLRTADQGDIGRVLYNCPENVEFLTVTDQRLLYSQRSKTYGDDIVCVDINGHTPLFSVPKPQGTRLCVSQGQLFAYQEVSQSFPHASMLSATGRWE